MNNKEILKTAAISLGLIFAWELVKGVIKKVNVKNRNEEDDDENEEN